MPSPEKKGGKESGHPILLYFLIGGALFILVATGATASLVALTPVTATELRQEAVQIFAKRSERPVEFPPAGQVVSVPIDAVTLHERTPSGTACQKLQTLPTFTGVVLTDGTAYNGDCIARPATGSDFIPEQTSVTDSVLSPQSTPIVQQPRNLTSESAPGRHQLTIADITIFLDSHQISSDAEVSVVVDATKFTGFFSCVDPTQSGQYAVRGIARGIPGNGSRNLVFAEGSCAQGTIDPAAIISINGETLN